MKWWPTLRLVARAAKSLDRLATAAERIANHLEGAAPVVDLPDAPADPAAADVGYAYRDDAEIARAWAIEQELTPILGRAPTPDEIVHALDGVAWTADDAATQRTRVLREVAEQAAGDTVTRRHRG